MHAGPYKERLLPLPACLGGAKPVDDELSAGLHLTGHFLQKHIYALIHKDLPQPRIRLANLVASRYNNEAENTSD